MSPFIIKNKKNTKNSKGKLFVPTYKKHRDDGNHAPESDSDDNSSVASSSSGAGASVTVARKRITPKTLVADTIVSRGSKKIKSTAANMVVGKIAEALASSVIAAAIARGKHKKKSRIDRSSDDDSEDNENDEDDDEIEDSDNDSENGETIENSEDEADDDDDDDNEDDEDEDDEDDEDEDEDDEGEDDEREEGEGRGGVGAHGRSGRRCTDSVGTTTRSGHGDGPCAEEATTSVTLGQAGVVVVGVVVATPRLPLFPSVFVEYSAHLAYPNSASGVH